MDRNGATNMIPGRRVDYHEVKTLGFRQSCSCPPAPPRPCVVYDPFGGAGTVPLVASNMGRHGIMTELSAKYIRMAKRRITRPHAEPERVAREEHHPLFDGLG